MAIPGYSKTQAELLAIGPGDLGEGVAYKIRDLGGAWFEFYPASTAAASATVLIPADNPAAGRWHGASAGGGSVALLTNNPSTVPTQAGALAIVNEVSMTNVFDSSFNMIGITITKRSIWGAIADTTTNDWKRFADEPITIKIDPGYTTALASENTITPTTAGLTPEYLGQRAIVIQDGGGWEYSYHWVAKMSGTTSFGGPKYTWQYINLGSAGGAGSGGS